MLKILGNRLNKIDDYSISYLADINTDMDKIKTLISKETEPDTLPVVQKAYNRYKKGSILNDYLFYVMVRNDISFHRRKLESLANQVMFNGMPLYNGYLKAVNQAFTIGKLGVDNTEFLKNLADSGLKINGYKMDYVFDTEKEKLASETRDKVLVQISDEIGADGVEISAHQLCAIDHLPIQGKQFSNEAYADLNSGLARPIGTMNCKHYTMPVVLGVTPPRYTKEQLDSLAKRNTEKEKIMGKIVNRYEADQWRNRVKSYIEKYNNRYTLAKTMNNKQLEIESKNKITFYENKYKILTKFIGD